MCFTLDPNLLPMFVLSRSLQTALWSGKTTFNPSRVPHLRQSIIIALAYGDEA